MEALLLPLPDDFEVAGPEVQGIAISEPNRASLRNAKARPCRDKASEQDKALTSNGTTVEPMGGQGSTGGIEPTATIRACDPARCPSLLQSLPMLPEQEHPCPAQVSHCRGAGEPHENARFSLAGGIISREGEHGQDGGV